jgi:hypothetical protein
MKLPSDTLLNVSRIEENHRSWTDIWHTNCNLNHQTDSTYLKAIELNHSHNFALWHEEDIARRDDIPLERIRKAKRTIDMHNQARNNAMELIDDYVLSWLHSNSCFSDSQSLHSETPGMMIDRLSILSLKHYHMNEQVHRSDVSCEHIKTCSLRVAVILEQQTDLHECLRCLLAELISGVKTFKVYRQFKMYNDPELNPQLYAKPR